MMTHHLFLPKGFRLLRIALAFLLAGLVPASSSFALDSAPSSVVVELRKVEIGFPVDAIVEAVNQVTVAAQIAGRVTEMRIDAGQRVKRGELLMRIDTREAAGADASARAALAQASAVYERTRNLYAQKFVSKAALDQAAAGWQAAQGAARSSGAALSHGAVAAPITGIVAQRLVEQGGMAVPGVPLVTVFDPKGMRVIASLPQYRLAELKKVTSARIEFPETGKWVDAVKVEILPTVDSRSHTATARLYLPENLDGVMPGIFVRAHFTIGTAQKITVPPAAVMRRGEVTAVYVLDDAGLARLRQIRLGEAVSGGDIEVLAGISAGERISLEPVKKGIESKAMGSR